MFRSCTLLLLCASLFCQPAHATLGCEILLETREQQIATINREVNKAIQTSPRLKRMSIRIRKLLLKNQILKNCAKAGTCTDTQLTQVVQEVIVQDFKTSNARNLGLFIGGIAGFSSVFAGITVLVNPQAEFFSTVVQYSLAQLAYAIGQALSSVSEQIYAGIRRSSFAWKERTQSSVSSNSLENTANRTHATYTLLQQQSIDRIFTVLNPLHLNFQSAAAAYQNEDFTGMTALIANAAMQLRHYLKDIEPEELALVNTIYATFLIKVEKPSRFKDATLIMIRERYAANGIVFDEEAKAFYQHTLDAWLVDPSLP